MRSIEKGFIDYGSPDTLTINRGIRIRQDALLYMEYILNLV
jgi:hypothetical protein